MAGVRVERDQIYKTKAHAALWLLQQSLIGKEFQLQLDNQVLVFCTIKECSSIPIANDLCKELFTLRSKGHIITTKWVPTDKNPADLPSRINIDALPLGVPVAWSVVH